MKLRASVILVVDDEELGREDLRAALSTEGYEIVAPRTQGELRRALGEGIFDLVVTDIKLDDEQFGGGVTGGLDVIRTIKEQSPLIPVIAITGWPKLQTPWGATGLSASLEISVGVAAMLLGAFDFLERGVPGIRFRELLRRKVKLALECRCVHEAEAREGLTG